jgi:hypothetical protein
VVPALPRVFQRFGLPAAKVLIRPKALPSRLQPQRICLGAPLKSGVVSIVIFFIIKTSVPAQELRSAVFVVLCLLVSEHCQVASSQAASDDNGKSINGFASERDVSLLSIHGLLYVAVFSICP